MSHQVIPEKPALVGVIQTSSERDHNSESGSNSFDELELDWVEFEFHDESTVQEFFHGVRDRRFTAACFGSNALFNPVIHAAACSAAEVVSDAAGDGMGVVLLQQFLPDGDGRSCDFLPAFHRLEYRGAGYGRIEEIRVVSDELHGIDDLAPDKATFGNREPALWSTMHPLHEGAWCALVTADVAGTEHVVLRRTRESRGRIIASALPLDWMADRQLLTYAIRMSVRALGTLYIRSPQEIAQPSIATGLLLGRSVAKAGHLSSVTVDDPGQVSSKNSPYADFSHLVVSEEWSWPDLTGLSERRIRGRLENGGSVAAYGSADVEGGERVLAVVSGRPVYLQLAQQFASWYRANERHFIGAPTSQVRALAVAAHTVNECIVDAGEVPLSLALDEVDKNLRPFYASRLKGTDNVDGHVLPTASVASVMHLLGHPSEEIAPLIRWIQSDAYVSSFAAKQQAVLWLPGLDLPLDRAPETDLEEMYRCLLAVKARPNESPELLHLMAMLGDPDQSVSRRAIIAESLSATGDEVLMRVARKARSLRNELDAAFNSEHPSLAVICLLTAFLIRVHHAQELTAGQFLADQTPTSSSSEVEADLRNQLRTAIEVAETTDLQARKQANAWHAEHNEMLAAHAAELLLVRTFATTAYAGAVGLAIAIVLALAGVAAWRLEATWPTWVAGSVGAAGLLFTVLRYLGLRADGVGCEPRWLRWIRELSNKG